MSKGKFIVFESVDGAGKTTIIERLKKEYPDFIYTNEPGGCDLGKEVRRMIKDPELDINSKAQILLVFANREMNLQTIVRPNIESGKVVVSDRFTDSTYAYQTLFDNHDHGKLNLINYLVRNIVGLTKPDLTIVLDVSYEESIRRMSMDKNRTVDRFDGMTKEMFNKIRDYYRARVKLNPNYVLVNTEVGIEETYQTVLNHIKQTLEGV